MSEPKNGRGALAAGGIAAILASACCLGPLVLVALGFSGAWIGNLTVLEPYRPIFIGATLVALFFAWRSIFRLAHVCKPGDVCAWPPWFWLPSLFPTSCRCSTERRLP
jgi:mercuric ion transport protein